MMEYSLLDLAPLVLYIFGALTFSVLTAFYWGERRRVRGSVLPPFTLACAAAFLSNLFFPAGLLHGLMAGIIPPMILHLVYETEGGSGRGWRWALFGVYALGLAANLLRGLDAASEYLYGAPAVTLALASATGLLMQVFARRPMAPRVRTHRRAIGVLLALMLVCAAASLAGFGAFLFDAPDYLLLAFFCVTLYYRERLVFFDVLVKRGAFLAVGLAILAAGFMIGRHGELSPWMYALGLPLFWLAGPWVYDLLARAIDRVWLRRPYSAAEAERQFIRDIQAATTEEDLRAGAEASLGAIFQAPAAVRFHHAAPADSEGEGLSAEWIRLQPRPDGIPFLSGDRRLLQSLAGALGVVLENVRFRAERRRQEEREQQLRWLASRAELKALRAQINPHFLFNSLSVIAGLVHYQPEKADEAIEQLAHVFRYTLRKSEHEWAPLCEEVDFVSAYLRIEQARFGDRLRVEFHVDPAAASLAIPAMSIQPLIENAIKHGISAVEGPGTVGLHAALEAGRLRLEVSDSGPGFPAGFSLDNGEGHGLRNVVERLRGYYGDDARLSWESRPGGEPDSRRARGTDAARRGIQT
jgi:signal transduction histidine kinase